MNPETPRSRPPGPLTCAAAGFAAVLGWSAFDAAFFLARGVGAETLRLAPWALGGALVYALVTGLIGRRRPLVLAVLGFCVVLAVLPRLVDLPLSQAQAWLPRCLVLLLLAWMAALAWSRTSVVGPLPAAFACGLLAAVVKTVYRQGWVPDTLILGTAALVWAATRLVPRPWLRLAASALCVALPVTVIVQKGLDRVRIERPDLARPEVAAEERPNLILIVLDTVRADDLGCYGAEGDVTPALDAFAAEHATRHTQARSTSPFTLPSHASLLTGLPPAEHHATHPGVSARPIRSDRRTLAEELRGRGFQTAAIVANHVYLNETYGFERGFERFDARRGGSVGEYLALAQMHGAPLRPGHLYYRDAAEITDDAIEWLEADRRADEPFFLFLNYLDPHVPYLPPPHVEGALGDERPRDPLNPEQRLWPLLHRRELRYTDEEVGRLLARLRDEDLLGSSVVIVTSDHGESLGQHGIPWHNWHLFDSLIHVPLLVKPAGERAAATDDAPISGAGVFYLALRELGIDVPEPPVDVLAEWYPHLPVSPSQKRWGERAGIDPEAHRVTWLEGERKIIVSSNGEVLAFDLRADPDEEHPLELDEDELAAARARAAAWWEAHPLPEASAPELDQERLDALEALGYGG